MCQNGGTGWKIAGVACREELAERFEGGTVMKDSTVSVREEAVKLNGILFVFQVVHKFHSGSSR